MVKKNNLLLYLLLLICPYEAFGQSVQSTDLEIGRLIDRSIASNEKQAYQITLAEGEYIDIQIEQQGTDAVAALHTPAGEKVQETCLQPRGYALGRLFWIARDAGKYRVEIHTNDLKSAGGRYRLTLLAKRTADGIDQEYFSLFQPLKQQMAEAIAAAPADRAEIWRRVVGKSEEAAASWQVKSRPAEEGHLLSVACYGYSELNDRENVRSCYQRLSAIAKAAGDTIGQAEAQFALGDAMFIEGRFQTGLEHYQQALAIYRGAGEARSEAILLAGISLCHASLGDYRKARRIAEKARGLAEQRQDERAMRIALIGLGSVETFAGDKRLAISHFEKARTFEAYLPVTFKSPDAHEALVLDLMAQAYLFLGELSQAETVANLALQAHLRSGIREGRAYSYLLLGSICLRSGRIEQARQHFSQALSDLIAWRHPSVQLLSLSMMADLARQQGNLNEAARQLRRAHDLLNDFRFQLASPDWRALYVSAQRYLYDEYLNLLMTLHRQNSSGDHLREAIRVVEHERARTLVEMLAERKHDLLERVSPNLAAREKELRLRISEQAFARRREKESKSAEIDGLLDDYGRLQAEIREQVPQYASLVSPPVLSLEDLQREILDEDTLLLEYARHYLFVIGPRSCEVFPLANRKEIEEDARQLHRVLDEWGKARVFNSPDERAQWQKGQQEAFDRQAAALSEKLLSPIAARLGEKRLLIVGDGALQYVPFSALPDPVAAPQSTRRSRASDKEWQPLVVRHEIISLPSASTLVAIRRNLKGRAPAPKSMAVLADPIFDLADVRLVQRAPMQAPSSLLTMQETIQRGDLSEEEEGTPRDGDSLGRLPFTRNEAMSILSLAPGTEKKLALDFSASRTLATSRELSDYQYIHFATHGILDTERPELSSLVFSLVTPEGKHQNGYLRTLDVYKLKLPSELVVLSGCRTGLGKEISGEGLIGLTRGFMYAGARRVMASLWRVNDRATAELMRRFYRHLFGRERLSPAAALRAAQVEMWRNGRWSASYYWAAFVVQGEF